MTLSFLVLPGQVAVVGRNRTIALWRKCRISKVEPMKDVARMIRRHFDGIIAWAQTRRTIGFMEALNGVFQAAKRKARGFTRFSTMRTVIYLIAVKLDVSLINPHTA